jgi:hypothetical protein
MTDLTKPNALSEAAFGALTAEQIQQIPTASLASLDQSHYQYLTSGQVAAMSAAQITALKHPEWLAPAAVGGLTAQQVSAIAPAAWSKMSSAWMNGLSTSAFSAVPAAAIGSLGAAVVRGLSDADFQAMTAAQFAAIADNDWIPLSAVGKLRPEQLQTTTDWDSTSARWLNALSPEAFAAIPAAGINQMSLAALQGLDATRRAIALKSADEMHAGYIDMASKDASVNYDSVLSKLQLMCSNIGSDGLSAAQFDAFNNTLASAKGAAGNQTYVSSLMGSMGAQVNMSADSFNQAVCKWFLGTNNPTANGYADVTDSPLFNGSVQQAAVGVAQGQLGDCWLISSLEALAATAPERLNGLISSNGNGTYAVKFYDGSADRPVFVTVDGKVANYGASTAAGGWARLIEDAFVEASASGLLQGDGYKNWNNDIGQLDGGISAWAMKTLTGGSSKSFSSGTSGWEAVKAALEDGSGIVTYASYGKSSKGADGSTQMVSGHAFAITGIDEVNHKYIFRNPWGSNYVFEISPEELDAISGNGEFVVMESPIEYGSAFAHFAATDWSTVSADWINSQSAAMIAAISPTALKQLCGSTVNGLSAATLQIMSSQQLLALPHLDQLSASAVAGLLAAQTKVLSADWYNGLSAAAIAALPVASIGTLPQAVLQGLGAAAVGAMTTQQIAAIAHPGWLNPAGAAGLTAAQIPVLNTSWSYQSADWFNALSLQAVAALPVKAVQNMSSAAFQGLSASTIHAMTPQLVAAFAHPDKLSVAAFGGLTAAQVPSIAVSWYWMSAAQLNALSPEAFGAVPAAGINQMTKASQQGLDAIHRDIALRSADATHAGYIKTAPAAVTDWTQVTAAGMNALSAQALAAIAPADLQKLPASTIQGLSTATVAALSPQQIAALPHPEQLSIAAFGALTAAQVSAITAAWGQMSAGQLNAMTPDAFGAIAAAGINQMSKEALQGLDKVHHDLALKLADAAHAAILDPTPVKPAVDWSTITASDVNALSPKALAAVAPADLQKFPASTIQGLSAATVAALSPQQIAAIPHPEQLSVAAFGALTAAQVPAIAGSWGAMSAAQINAMTPQAIAALPAQGIKDIEWSAAEQGLSASTLHAMTAQQIAAMEHPDWLTAEAFSGLTAAQVPSVAISWGWMSADQLNALPASAFAAIPAAGINQMTKEALQGLDTTRHDLARKLADGAHAAMLDPTPPVTPTDWSRMTAADVNALSPAALSSVKPADLSKLPAATVKGLSADTLRAMNGKQVAHLPAIETLSASAVAALRPHQALKIAATSNWSKVDAKWLNALSSGAFAGLPASAINHLSSGSLQGLDAVHRSIALKSADAKHAGYLTPVAASTSSVAPLVQALASFNVPAAVTTLSHGNSSANSTFTLAKSH